MRNVKKKEHPDATPKGPPIEWARSSPRSMGQAQYQAHVDIERKPPHGQYNLTTSCGFILIFLVKTTSCGLLFPLRERLVIE